MPDEGPLDLESIEARAAAASAAPWTAQPNGSILHSGPSASRVNVRLGTYVVASVGAHDLGLPSPADAAFIAAARQDVPALLDALKEALTLIDKLFDPDPCWFDRGGWCQAHGQDSRPFCPDARAKEFLIQHGRNISSSARQEP